MTIILIASFVLFLSALLIFSFEVASLAVHGKFLSDRETVPYLEKYLPTSNLNRFGNKMLSGMPEFIADIYPPLCSKWYINNYGQIPRWSKAHKLIEKRHKELLGSLPVTKKKSLKDL